MKKVHLWHKESWSNGSHTLCGTIAKNPLTTITKEEVTCLWCQRNIKEAEGMRKIGLKSEEEE